MMKRKDTVVGQNTKGIEFLFRKNKVEWAKGRGVLKKGNVVDVEGIGSYQAKNVIIATGLVPIELPFLKFDEERILSNIGALKIPEVPKHLIVIGGGVIGLELGSVWRRLGAKVTVIELFPTILPGNDEEVIREADKIFRKQGLEIRTGTKVVGAERNGNSIPFVFCPTTASLRFIIVARSARTPSITTPCSAACSRANS
jgi:dihydrolipoamide dehydrogenase